MVEIAKQELKYMYDSISNYNIVIINNKYTLIKVNGKTFEVDNNYCIVNLKLNSIKDTVYLFAKDGKFYEELIVIEGINEDGEHYEDVISLNRLRWYYKGTKGEQIVKEHIETFIKELSKEKK